MNGFEKLTRSLPPEQRQAFAAALREMYHEQARAEKAQKVEQFRRLNRYAKPGQILFAGSSLMEQFPIHELQQGLDLPLYIYNRGVGGFTTAEMLAAMGPCVYDLKPAYIFLNIGTNDLNEPDCTPAVLAGRYRTILDDIRAHLPAAKLTLLAYYPVNEPIGLANPQMGPLFRVRTNAKIAAANEQVKALAAAYGAAFLNANAGITDETGNQKAAYTKEGMHMYADGYKQVLDALLPALRACR